MIDTMKEELAYLAGGCFWCTEAIFQRIPGVLKVTSGYSGGHLPNPTYHQVTTGNTGHAEVVEIKFDSTKVSFEHLLDLFFELHDPTTLNQQGHDLGTQYRSMILVTSPEQFATAMQKIAELNSKHKFSNPIVTEVVKFENFYPAEEDHQNFYNNNRDYSYCKVVIDPKIQKLIDITKNSYNII